MSDTPITDKAEQECNCARGCHVSSYTMEKLERELNLYKAAVEKLMQGYYDACPCNDCRTKREVKASLEAST